MNSNISISDSSSILSLVGDFHPSLALQPLDHLLIISNFLDCPTLIFFYRLNSRFYSIPITHSIFLLDNFNFYICSSRFVFPSSFHWNFRFFFSSLRIKSKNYYRNIRSLFDSKSNSWPSAFSRLRSLALDHFEPSMLKPPFSLLFSTVETIIIKLRDLADPNIFIPQKFRNVILKVDTIFSFSEIFRNSSIERLEMSEFYYRTGENLFQLNFQFFPISLKFLDLSSISSTKYFSFDHLIQLEELKFPISFDDFLNSFLFPPSLKKLKLGNKFNQPINPGNLPESLEELRFSGWFNQKILPYSLPSRLKLIEFGYSFNQNLEINSLPNSLTSLKFGTLFDQIIEPEILPFKLRDLTFVENFNQKFLPGSLPNSLQSIHFSSKFNQEFDAGILPSSLASLDLGYSFNQKLKRGIFPSSLIHLKLSEYFNSEIEPGALPQELVSLNLGKEFNQPLKSGTFPASLNLIHFPDSFNQPLQPGIFSEGIRKFSFGRNFTQKLKSNIFPSSLRILEFENHSDHFFTRGIFPDGLISLKLFGKSGTKIKPGALPNSLEYLFINLFSQSLIAGLLPRNLKSLKFVSFNQSIEPGSIPSSLAELDLGKHFNQPLRSNSLFSTNIRSLNLPDSFNSRIKKNAIPQNLIEINFNKSFSRPLSEENFPPSIRSIQFFNLFPPILINSLESKFLTHVNFIFSRFSRFGCFHPGSILRLLYSESLEEFQFSKNQRFQILKKHSLNSSLLLVSELNPNESPNRLFLMEESQFALEQFPTNTKKRKFSDQNQEVNSFQSEMKSNSNKKQKN